MLTDPMASEVIYSFLLQVVLAGALGLMASHFWLHQRQENGLHATVTDPCEDLIEKAKLSERFKLGTKTPYQFEAAVTDDSFMHGCPAVQLYAIFRHGTRYPSLKYIQRWDSFQALLREKLSSPDLPPLAKQLQAWVNPFTKDYAVVQITEKGMLEHYCLARRLQRRYPRLLNRSYVDSVFSFRTTQKRRAVKSLLSFAAGLFEGQGPLNGYQPVHLESDSPDEDELVFFDHPCPRYDQHVTKNESLSEMIDSFMDSSAIRAVVERVQAQIDPEQKYWSLTADIVMTIYRICIHEMGVFGRSRWCSLLSGEDMAALQYYLDLKTYWKRGYGFDINWQRSLPLVTSILDFFTNHDDSSQPYITLRFAHAETLIPLVCFLGLFRDKEPLLPTNFEEMRNHLFDVSKIAPYSGNVVFALYECPKSRTDMDDTLFIRLLVNEHPMAIPECGSRSGSDLCPLSDLQKLVNRTKTLSDSCAL